MSGGGEGDQARTHSYIRGRKEGKEPTQEAEKVVGGNPGECGILEDTVLSRRGQER